MVSSPTSAAMPGWNSVPATPQPASRTTDDREDGQGTRIESARAPFNTGPRGATERGPERAMRGAAVSRRAASPRGGGAPGRQSDGRGAADMATSAATALTSGAVIPARLAIRACWRRVSSSTTGSPASRCRARQSMGGARRPGGRRPGPRRTAHVVTELELVVEDALERRGERWNSARTRVSRSGRPSWTGSAGAAAGGDDCSGQPSRRCDAVPDDRRPHSQRSEPSVMAALRLDDARGPADVDAAAVAHQADGPARPRASSARPPLGSITASITPRAHCSRAIPSSGLPDHPAVVRPRHQDRPTGALTIDFG